MDDTKLKQAYKLDECLSWIVENNFSRVILQLKQKDLEHSVDIVNYLNESHKSVVANIDHSLELYVTQSKTCCVDLFVTQHASKIDAIIHFGNVCLSKQALENQDNEPPILFVLSCSQLSNKNLQADVQQILANIKQTLHVDPNDKTLVIYDTCLIEHAEILSQRVRDEGLSSRIDVAKLHSPSESYFTTRENESRFLKGDLQDAIFFGHYILEENIDQYTRTIYLGDRRSIHLSLHGPRELYVINCYQSLEMTSVNTSRLLNQRMALVGRLKDEEELKIGVIITNPLPNLSDMIRRLEIYAEARKHTLYFISMIQTIDECKIGNFDLCDAFVVINSCTCSTILESLVFNRAIITDLEFKLACGFEAEYGRVNWPGSSSHLSADDIINKRKVSDVSLALVHTRNELLERCSQARANKWSGLEYKASLGSDEGVGGENLMVEEGLSGIASTYASEPLRKSGISTKGDNIKQKVSGSETNSVPAAAYFPIVEDPNA